MPKLYRLLLNHEVTLIHTDQKTVINAVCAYYHKRKNIFVIRKVYKQYRDHIVRFAAKEIPSFSEEETRIGYASNFKIGTAKG